MTSVNIRDNPQGLKCSAYVSSKNRAQGTPSAFPFDLGPTARIDSFTFINAQIDQSWYIITSSNNTFSFIENPATAVSCTIPVGNYTAATVAAALATAMTAATTIAAVYTGTYSTVTSHITITSSIAASWYPRPSLNARLAYILGFVNPSTGAAVDPAAVLATSYTGASVPHLSARVAYISCIELSGATQSSVQRSGLAVGGNIIATIPMLSVQGQGTVSYQSTFYETFRMNGVYRNLTFQLLDEDYNVIDMNGGQWNMYLQLNLA